MKLLLTSNGLANDSIAGALEELTGKPAKDVRVAFIPTAANAERGNKDWLIMDLYRILQRGYFVDVIDLTAFKNEKLREVLVDKDVIFVGGGNTFYLSYWMQKSGFSNLIPELLKTKVYAGISAGSIVAGKSLILSKQALKHPVAYIDKNYDELGPEGESADEVMGLADLVFRPHLNSDHFPLARVEHIKPVANGLDWPVYALDDESALKIVDGEVDIISESEWWSSVR